MSFAHESTTRITSPIPMEEQDLFTLHDEMSQLSTSLSFTHEPTSEHTELRKVALRNPTEPTTPVGLVRKLGDFQTHLDLTKTATPNGATTVLSIYGENPHANSDLTQRPGTNHWSIKPHTNTKAIGSLTHGDVFGLLDEKVPGGLPDEYAWLLDKAEFSEAGLVTRSITDILLRRSPSWQQTTIYRKQSAVSSFRPEVTGDEGIFIAPVWSSFARRSGSSNRNVRQLSIGTEHIINGHRVSQDFIYHQVGSLSNESLRHKVTQQVKSRTMPAVTLQSYANMSRPPAQEVIQKLIRATDLLQQFGLDLGSAA